MADFGLNSLAAALTGKTGAEFRAAFEAFLDAAAASDSGVFGNGATMRNDEIRGPQTGDIIDYAGVSAPSGWLECDGREVSRSTYSSLWSRVGTRFGNPSNSSVFKLPNLDGAVEVGRGGTRQAGPGTSVGDSHGTDGPVLTTANLPSHNHELDTETDLGGGHPHTWPRYPAIPFETEDIRGGDDPEDGASGQQDIPDQFNRARDQIIDTIIDKYGTADLSRGLNAFLARSDTLYANDNPLGSTDRQLQIRAGNLSGLRGVGKQLLGPPAYSISEGSSESKTPEAGGHGHTFTGGVESTGSGTVLGTQNPSIQSMKIIKT